METHFLNIYARINDTRTCLESMSFKFAHWAMPHFDAMRIPDGPDFPRATATPELMAERLLHISAEDQIDCQLSMIGLCLNQMGVVNELIELQNCYKNKESDLMRASIDQTIDTDGQRYLTLAANVAALRELRVEQVDNPMDENSYRSQMQRLMEEYEQAENGHIRRCFQHATTKQQLLEYIFEKRLNALESSLKSVERLNERIRVVLEDYAVIRIARDENIVPDSDILKEVEDHKAAFCRHALVTAQGALDMAETFAENLWEMGTFENDYKSFAIERYKPVSVGELPKFSRDL